MAQTYGILNANEVNGILSIRNYIANPQASFSTLGWGTYKDAAQSTPVDGTGGSATLTLTRTVTDPILGVAAFLATTTAANLQGEGFSYDFSIERADQGKVLRISFDYQVISGTYADGDYGVYIYDTTNSQVIQPAGFSILNTTTYGKQIATFQTAINSRNYRLIVHRAVSTASASTVQFDNFYVGPQIVQYGAPVTEPTAYTPTITGFGTIGSSNLYSWRDGAYLYIQGTIVVGTPTATEARISIGYNGVNANVTTDSSLSTLQSVGTMAVNTPSTTTDFKNRAMLAEASKTYLTVGVHSSTLTGLSKANGNAVSGTGDTLSIDAKVRITGWSSNVQMSNDTDTRVVTAQARLAGGNQSITTSGAVVALDSKRFDTHGTMDVTTNKGRYTVAVPGFYNVQSNLQVVMGATATDQVTAYFIVNGGATQYGRYSVTDLVNNDQYILTCQTILQLNAGDYVEVFVIPSTQTITASSSATNDSCYMAIERLTGPSAIAASETVAARYTSTSTASITNTATQVDFATKDFDTHGAVTTGASWKFTCPVSGKYTITAKVSTSASAANATTSSFDLIVYKNSTATESFGPILYSHTTTAYAKIIGGHTLMVNCVAGDILDARVVTNTANSGTHSLAAFSTDKVSSIHIERVGN